MPTILHRNCGRVRPAEAAKALSLLDWRRRGMASMSPAEAVKAWSMRFQEKRKWSEIWKTSVNMWGERPAVHTVCHAVERVSKCVALGVSIETINQAYR